jgi:hypothetical protein
VIAVSQVAFVGAVVTDPAGAAARLGAVLDTPFTLLEDGAADQAHATVDLGDCVLALYPLLAPEASVACWGAVHPRPRCLSLGLVARDLAGAVHALGDAGVAGHHRAGDGAVVLDPATTASMPVVLTDRLLPGDPRASA